MKESKTLNSIFSVKHFFISLFALMAVLPICAQHVYQGGNVYGTKLYTWDGQHLYQGGNVYGTKLATWDGSHICQGGNVYGTKLYTYDARHVYQGSSVYGTKLLTVDTPIPIPVLYIILGN